MTTSPKPQPAPESGTSSPERYACALHEVGNALTVVLGWLEIAGKNDDPAEVKKAIEVALEHARRGQVMARRAIGARADSNRPKRTAADVAEFAAVSVRPQAAPQGVEVVTEYGPGTDGVLDGDNHILQILTNLLLNAVSFSPNAEEMPGGSTIELAVARDGDAMRFTVKDQGPGVTSARRAHLFTAPTSTREGGAGIGLPHSRQLAREAGGDLALLPLPETQGACFELSWPISGSTGVRPSIAASAAQALAEARVLVLEDDPAISSLVELSFEARGAEVIVVEDYDQLSAVLDGRPVLDAVLLDLSPIANRVTACLDRIAQVAPDCQAVLMSGSPTGIPEEADGRFASWVRKPFDMEQLISTVAELLRTR